MRTLRTRALALAVAFVFFGSLAGPAMAASAAFDKGKADGLTFGKRAGSKKGFKDGHSKGYEDGHAKGMSDAEDGMNNPAPQALPDPPPPPAPPVQDPAPEPALALPAPPAEDPAPAQEPTKETITTKGSESPTEEALRLYPNLLPKAPDLEGTAPELATDPTASTQALGGLISDENIVTGTEYSKGFALGYMEGYKLTHSQGYDEGYEKGYAEGYAKGHAKFKELHYDANGNLLTPEQQYKKGRALLLQDKVDDGLVRFDLVLAGGHDGEWADDALYWKAWALYNTRQFSRAIKTCTDLAKTCPDSELSDDGLYCKGQCFEYLTTGGLLGIGSKKHYEDAAECFYNLVAMYPESNIVPFAYFRLGFNYERLKDKKAAIEAYTVVATQYQHSEMAFRAIRRLQRLGAWPLGEE